MGAAAPAASAAAWAKCFATAAQEEGSEVEALVPVLAALPAHERGGNVVTLFRRSLRDLDLGFALGAWRLLNKAELRPTGTWTLSPLSSAELEALLAALRVARSAALREVLMELVEQSHCRPPLASLAWLWARSSVRSAPCSAWRLHRVAQRGSAQRWREAKELAYFQQLQRPLVDPRSPSLRGLRLEQLEELLRGHGEYLQEPAFDEELQCHRRPSCLDFYAKVLKPASIPGRSFVELYLPQEVQLVVSHSSSEAFEDLVLSLQRHRWSAENVDAGPEMLQTRSTRSTWGYWLSLLSSGPAEVPEGQMAAAMETAQQFLIAWDDAGRWSTRLWCLYELLMATKCEKPISVTCRSGVLGRPALAEQSRRVAQRLVSSDPRCAADDLKTLGETLGEAGFQALDRALLAAAAPLLCIRCTSPEELQSSDRFRPLMDALPPSPRCVLLQSPWGDHGAAAALQRRIKTAAATLTVEMCCAVLADLMDAEPGEEDLLKLWFDFTMGDTDLKVMKRYQKLLIVLEDLEDAGRYATSILTWAGRFLTQPDVAMIITCRGEEQKWTPEQLARMGLATYDLVHLHWHRGLVHGLHSTWNKEPWSSALRLCIRMEEDGQLWVSGCTVDALCIGRHADLEVLEAGRNCFEVYENLVSKLLPLNPQQLEDFALELCCRGPPYIAPIPSSLRSCSLLRCHGAVHGAAGHRGRFAGAALRSLCAAQALRRRQDLPPQVISNQWPQVRHFLRRAVELDLQAPEEEVAVLRQKLKMARLLNANPSVLSPLLAAKAPSATAAVAAEALEAWLTQALEDEVALPQLLALASHSPALVSPAVLEMARAKVRLQELDLETVSLHEILVTLEACTVLPPKQKWPFAQRFLQQIKGRISTVDDLQLLTRLAAAAELAEAVLEEPLQEFLDASLPCHLAAAAPLLPQRRLGAGRYHSLLLQQGRVIAVGLNGQGETSGPALKEDLRYVAVAAGTQHSLLLRSDGVVEAFGLNLDGQTDVPTLPRPIVAVAAGGFHSLVLDDTGHCWAFGCNRRSQCQLPEQGPVVAVAAGNGHTLTLTGDGQVQGCGENGDGQCNVPDLFWEPSGHHMKYVAIAAGGRHSVLLRNDGKAVGIGWNFHGQCDLPRDAFFVSVACGEKHTLLLSRQGRVLALGDDGYGQCQVPQLPCGLRYLAIAAGHRHSLLLRSDGRVMAMGDDGEGQCQIPRGLQMDDS